MHMQTYSQWAPTHYDGRGLGCEDRQDWFVLPLIHCPKIAKAWEESNFTAAQRILSDAGAEFEVHYFGHWATDFEIILLAPEHLALGQAIEARLADYPFLDEDDVSNREWSEACEAWEHTSMRERVALSKRFGFHLMACRRDEFPQDDSGGLQDYLVGN